MVKLTPEKQAEVNRILTKIYAEMPSEAQAQINQIQAEAAQEIEDCKTEFEARIQQLKSGSCRLIPIAELAWNAAFAARQAEPLESRKDLAACESGRAFIRVIKAALLDGSLVAREQGSGIPVNDRSWCLENDTLLSLPKMMPHDRLMVRTDEVETWLDKMGIAIDALPLVQLATEGITLVQQDPATTESEEPAGEQTACDTKERSTAHALKPEESPEERRERIFRRSQELGGRGKKGVTSTLAKEEEERTKRSCSVSNIKRILNPYKKQQESKATPQA